MNLSRNFAVCAAVLCTAAVSLSAQINYPVSTRLEDGWLFLRGDVGNIWETVRPSAPGLPESVPIWSEVTVPHCFNATDAVDPYVNYYQGPGWYKTLLSIENPYREGRTLLHFEGAGQKSEVYVYTEKVASHVGGYDEWSVDITDAVKRFIASADAARFGGKVPVSIRCDNSRDAEMIPSDMSDFNVYSGMYRYVNLVYTPSLALSSLKADACVDAAGRKGKVSVCAGISGWACQEDASLTISVYGPDGRLYGSSVIPASRLKYSNTVEFDVPSPELWSPSSPVLYTCEAKIESSAGKMACRDRFGFRHFEFKEKGPFFLNGRRLLLRGTHRHEDHAGTGAAMTEEMIVREMSMIKDMGVNFIRLGHYQQSRIVLDLCDSLGILVWEEIPWCRGGLGGPVYKAQARRMLTNMINQHRNHPSVILWGLGNENDWSNDFPEFDTLAIRDFMGELNDLAHSLDNTRKTCIRRCDFCKDIVDVYSPSIWAGWYRGLYRDYKDISHAEMQTVSHFLHVEWGADSHALRHSETPYRGMEDVLPGAADERLGDASMYGGDDRASKDGGWSETYQCDLIDWHLKEQETMPWLTGTAYWPFKDFSTPLRPENPVPYVNQKGVVERDLTPKEAYYVFQSYWTETPMVHIYGHTWPVRWGDAGEERIVKVYSNCDRAELFLNGRSLGVKKRDSQDFPAAGLRWNVTFRPGDNTLKAVATTGKVAVEDSINVYYETRKWGEPVSIELSVLPAGDGDVWVKAELKDAAGVTCLDARNFVEFESAGDCIMHADLGTSTGSRKVQVFNGVAKIRVTLTGRKAVIAVRSSGIETGIVNL